MISTQAKQLDSRVKDRSLIGVVLVRRGANSVPELIGNSGIIIIYLKKVELELINLEL